MKLNEIPEKAQLYLNFTFINREYCMGLYKQFQVQEAICIQGVCNNGKPIEASRLENVSLVYKANDGVYNFNDIILRLVQYKGNHLYIVTSDSEAKRENRRADFRVYIGKSVIIKVMNDKGNAYKLVGELRDLSLTGMGIIINHKIENVNAIGINLEFNERTHIPLIGKIVNITELSQNKGFLYGCYFGERKEILSTYILKQQLKNRPNIITKAI